MPTRQAAKRDRARSSASSGNAWRKASCATPSASALTRRIRKARRVTAPRCGWILRRTIGWLGNLRRLTVRDDRLLATYGGFFHPASALLVLRRVLK